MAKKIQLRRDISTNWENENPPVILSQGEIGLEYVIENGKPRFSSFKIGDGSTKWNDLPYALSTNRLSNSLGTSYIEVGGDNALENIKFYNDEINTIDVSSELFEVKRAVDVSILSETVSVDIFTGALTVAGGVGVQGDINIAGKITADSILVAQDLEVDVIGDLQGDVTGNLIGDIYSENAVKILDSGTDGTNAFFVGSLIGNVTSSGSSNFSNITITGGAIDSTGIGQTTPAPITATSLDVIEDLHLSGNFQVGADKFLIEAITGNTAIAGTLDTAGDLSINTDRFNVESNTGNTAIAGTLHTVGDFDINTDKFTVEASTGNTSIAGTLDTAGDLSINTDKFNVASSTGNTAVAGTLRTVGNFDVNTDKFNVEASTGNTSIAGTLQINTDKFTVESSTGNTFIAGTLEVTDATTLESTLEVNDDLSINTDKFNVEASTGNTSIAGTLDTAGDLAINTDRFNVEASTGNTAVAGTLHVVDNFDVNTDKLTVEASTGNTSIAGTLHAVGNFDVNTDKFTVESSTGNTLIAGTLEVTNATTLRNTLEVDNNFSINIDKITVEASTGNTFIAGTLEVANFVILRNTLEVNADLSVNTDKFNVESNTGNTAIAGTLHVVDNFDINIDKLTVEASTGNTVIAGTLEVTDIVTLKSSLEVDNFSVNTDKFTIDSDGNTVMAGTLEVTGAATLESTLEVNDDLTVNTDKFIVDAETGNTSIAGNLDINTDKFTIDASTGNTVMAGTLEVTGAATLESTLEVNDDLTVNTDKFIVDASTGNTSIAGNLDINTDKFTVDASTGNTSIAGTLHATGNFDINTDKFTVDAATGNTSIAGNLDINTNKFTVDASTGNTSVDGTLHAAGNFDINTDKFTVAFESGNTSIAGTLEVTGAATLESTLEVNDDLTVNTDKFIVDAETGNTAIAGTLEVTGAATLESTLEVNDDLSVNIDKFIVDAETGNTGIAGTLHAVGNFDVNTDKFIVDAETGNTAIAGTLHAVGNFDVNTDKFTVDAETGNTAIAGTLEVTGAATLESTLEVNDDLSVNTDKFTVDAETGNTAIAGTLEVTGAATLESTLEVNDDLSVNTDKFIVDAETGNTGIAGTLEVTGAATLKSTLEVNDDLSVNTDKFTVDAETGNTGIAGTLHAVGNFDINTDKFTVDAATGNTSIAGTLHAVGNFDINTDKFTVDAATGNTSIAGTLHAVGNFDVNTDKFTVDAATGNTDIAGRLGIVGITTADRIDADKVNVTTKVDITGALAVTGTSEFTGDMTVGHINAVTLATSENVDITGALAVTGTSEFTGEMTADLISARTLETSGNIDITGALAVTGTSEFTGDMTVGHINAVTLATSENVDITGELNVIGLSTLDEVDIKLGNINNTVIGATTPTSSSFTDLTAESIDIKNAGTLKFKEPTTAGPAYVGLKSPDEIETSYTLTLPDALGIDGNILALNTLGNRLEFVSADLFGGGTINVSTENGDDANDGVNKPVKTVKRALQIASGIVYDVSGKPNNKKLVVSVANGEYYEYNPIIIPDNVSVQGAGLRACNIRPLNANLDMLRVRNGCYFTGFTFRDNLNANGIPQFTFDYAVSFDDPTDLNCDRTGYVNMPSTRPTITISPYIQNCSIISFLGANGVLVDGNKVNAPNKPKNAIEVENPEEGPVPEQGKSMVANAFTMLSFGGTGWRVINDAYAQIVSCFQIFCLNGSYCQSGGYLSITNSATNFGKYALRASGYSPNAFSFNRGIVVATGTTTNGAQQTIQAIGFGQLPVQDYVLRFRSSAYKNAYFDLLENKARLQQAVIDWIGTQVNGSVAPFNTSLSYNDTKCRRDITLILQAVGLDLALGTNFNAVVTGLAYQRGVYTLFGSQKTVTVSAINYAKSQTLGLSQVSSDITATARATAAFNEVIDIIENGLTSTSNSADDLIFPTPTGATSAQVNAKNQLVDNRSFLRAEIIAWINVNYPSLVYNSVKCSRDIGYIVDALCYDILYGGNSATILAAQSYFDGANVSVLPSLQRTATAAAFNRLSTIIQSVLLGQLIQVSTGNSITQNTNAGAADSTETSRVSTLVSYITTSITDNSLSSLPSVDLPSVTWAASALQTARNGILSSVTTIVNNTINYITVENEFDYDQSLCYRDVGLVIEAVANDILTGGNSRSVEAGLSYANANLDTLTAQKTQNIAAFNYLKSQALLVVADFDIDSVVAEKFNIITSIINDPATAPVSVSFSNIGDITSNYQDIQPIDLVQFNSSTDINFVDNVFNITGHGLFNGQKVIYSNDSNPSIPGLNNEQTYYVDFRTIDQFGLFYDNSLTTRVNILSNSTGQQKFIKNVKEFYVDSIIDSHTDYQKLTLSAAAGVSYKFVTGKQIEGITGGGPNRAYVYSYNALTRELIVSLDYVTLNNVISRRPFIVGSTITRDHTLAPNTKQTILVSGVESINTIFSVNVKILPVTSGTQLTELGTLPEKQIWLHRPSIVNSSSHSWEYAGSGTDYNALPQNGGKGDPYYEQVSDLPGKVYTSGTNELGDFKVGNFIKAENKTGNVTFTNTVTIGALAALKLAVGNITVDEFSSDITLGDNEVGGPKGTRLSTQLAIRSFLENNLGDFINKKVSTNNLAGAIPQLNSAGRLNSDIIPALRTFISHRTIGYTSRLLLAESIPAVNVLTGDISTETYNAVELNLSGPITALDGTIVIQDGTGAKGVIVENASSATVIKLSSYLSSTFNATFNTTGTLTIGGDSTPSDTNTSVTPTAVGTIQSNQITNYTLSEIVPSQFLVLEPSENYDFTGVTTVTGVNSQAIGTVTGTKYGVAYTLDNANLNGGSGYTPAGIGTEIYKNVTLTSITGSGTGAKADITVTGGSVTNINLLEGGSNYAVNDLLRAAPGDIGGTYATQFSIRVTSIQKRLYVNIVGSQKFEASVNVPELIFDANSSVKTINLTTTTVKTFNADSIGGDVDYVNYRIRITNHGLENGDPVKYTSNDNIGGLVSGTVYYIRFYDSNTIELCTDYTFQNKISFNGSGTGTQTLTLSSIDIINDTVYLPNHGFITGNATYLIGTDLPLSIPSGNFYFIGSVTTNSFTLHQSKSNALSSINGQKVGVINLVSTGTGTATFKLQNVKVIDTINTSSKSAENWSRLSINPIDATNIISGLISTSRLAIGPANSTTVLRGDQTWVKAIQTLKVDTSSPLNLIGNYTSDGTVNSYYNDVTLNIDVVDGDEGGDFYSNIGVARFIKSQFAIGTAAAGSAGSVYIKSNVIDAGTVDGKDVEYLTNSSNHTIQPVNKGGTALTSYTIGDILYANGDSSFGLLNIGAADKVMVSTGSAPSWSDNINLKGLTVNGNVNLEGGIVSINSGIVKIADKNIELAAISSLSNLTGVIVDPASLTTINGLASTAGITGGMTLTRTGGTGFLSTNAKVVDVLNNSTITVQADDLNTPGDITFNLGGATDDTANDGGITVRGQTDKKLFWNKNSLSWTSSENMDLAVNKEYKINTTTVLSSTQVLGKGFTSSAGEIVTSGSYWARTFAFMGV